MIHYQTAGFDAIPLYDRDGNGIPDYLEFVALAFDRAWGVEIDSLGFLPPPDSLGNRLQQYPIYCKRLGNTYGITYFDLLQDIPQLPGNNYASYIEINTGFDFVSYPGVSDPIVRDSLAIAATAAHEFNHALQLGYNIWNNSSNPSILDTPDLWFIESSATYMEEVVTPQVNDYLQYLNSFFSSTDLHLADDSYFNPNRVYGEVVLEIMLGSLFGATITREVWEAILQWPAIQALDEVLKRKGSRLTNEVTRLAGWMYFTGERSLPGKFFPEATLYPEVQPIRVEDLNTHSRATVQDSLPALSFLYYAFSHHPDQSSFVYLSPSTSRDLWSGLQFPVEEPDYTYFPANIYFQVEGSPLDTSLNLAVVSGGWELFDVEEKGDYQITVGSRSGKIESEILVYPTIIRPEDNVSSVSFLKLPAGSKIYVFSSTGILIRSLEATGTPARAFWNLRNDDGRPVGTGVYLYRVVSDGGEHTGKLIIVR